MKKRMVAEWEPALGVMIGWPAALPKRLVVEFTHDTTLYLLCADNDGIADAKEKLGRWGADLESVRYLVVPKGDDECWPRDWGPQPAFDEQGNYRLIGPRYVLATPHCDPGHDNVPLFCTPWDEQRVPLSEFEGDTSDDLAAQAIARQLGVPFVKAPFAFTGGNVLNDGINSILSTEVLLFENRFQGLDDERYYQLVEELTGMSNYTVLSDYEEFSLNHVDCLLKIVSDHRLIVGRPNYDDALAAVYDDIVENEIGRALNSYGEPWEVIRVDAGEVVDTNGATGPAAYANSLILNECVYVPQYGIDTDEPALETWRRALPGYTVKGFLFDYDSPEEAETYNPGDLYGSCGWAAGDVLHCRTRAVWDPQMLHIDATIPLALAIAGHELPVNARVVAYSGAPITQASLRWRREGEETFSELPLVAGPTHDVRIACIPAQDAGTKVEWYVEAADASGRHETYPRTAPAGFMTATVR